MRPLRRAANSAASLTRLARSAPESRGAARQDGRVHVRRQRNLAHVDLQDLLAATDVGQRHHDLAVEAARTQQRGVEHVGTVGRGDHDDALARLEAVHLDQHLVQGLLAFVVAAAQAGATLAADRVDFVDEDDAGRMLLGVLEHVAHAGRAHADEHFNEVGTRDAEERHLGLAGDGLGQQRLAGTGRADHQHAARNATAQLLELARVAQEVDQFLDVFLGFVAAGHVHEGDLVGVLVKHAGARLAEAERAATTAALHLAHEEHPDADQQQHGEPGHEDAHQQRLLFARLARHLHAVLQQVGDHPEVARRGQRVGATGVRGDVQHVAARTALHVHLADASRLGVVHELRVGHAVLGLGASVKLLEDGEQHKGYHHPDSDFRK